MKKIVGAMIAGAAGIMALGMSSAFADDHRGRDRGHDRDGANVSFSISVGDAGYHDRRYDRRHYDGRRNGYRGRSGRVVNRQVYDTRYRARIILTEEVVRGRRGPRLVCTVQARGPQARYVSERRMHRIARRGCSPRARVRVYA